MVKKERLGSKGGGKALMMQSAPRLATVKLLLTPRALHSIQFQKQGEGRAALSKEYEDGQSGPDGLSCIVTQIIVCSQ